MSHTPHQEMSLRLARQFAIWMWGGIFVVSLLGVGALLALMVFG